MNNDHDLEKKIRYALKGHRLPRPQQKQLEGFENEVWTRIEQGSRPSIAGLIPALAVGLIILAIAGYLLWLTRPVTTVIQPAQETPTIQEAIFIESVDSSSAESPFELPDEGVLDREIDARVLDLLVLEWLGEAEGLLDDATSGPMLEGSLPKVL